MSEIAVAPWERSGALVLCAGIDLGLSGAIALIDASNERVFSVCPMPIVMRKVGKTNRKRLDYDGLWKLIGMCVDLGATMFCYEIPGAGFGAGGRELGEQVGAFRAFCHVANVRTEQVTPGKWKQALQVPADKKEACLRAEILFPKDREKLRGERGGRADGKAEAAMIGLYGVRKYIRGG